MKLYCQNQNCGAELEDIITSTAIQACPKCGGSHFANVKNAAGFRVGPIFELTMFPAPACAAPLIVEFFTVKI